MNKMNTAWTSESDRAHGDNWRHWLGHLKDQPDVSGLELGTWMGESAEWMLTNIFTHEKSRYYCVDTFAGSEEHHLAGIDCTMLEQDTRQRLAPFGGRVSICKGLTHEVLRNLTNARFDFIYVDAAHDALNVLRDAVLAFDLLKLGGVMIFDDYAWTVMPDAIDRPKIAVDAFVSCYARQVEVIGMGWQLALNKVA